MDENELTMLKIALGSFYQQLRKVEELPNYYGNETSIEFYDMIRHLGELIDVPDLDECRWD